MRFVVVGAGAIGGTIGWRLHDAGYDVVLVARGEHLAVMRRAGLRLRLPDRDAVHRIRVAGSPDDVDLREDDIAVVATKTQHAAAALDALAGAAPPSIAVVCAQNGVAGERMALRRFHDVYGMCVRMPATFVEPGVVEAYGTPYTGILDVGRYPRRADEADAGKIDGTAARITAALESAAFSSRAVPDIMRFKYRKLVGNLRNALEAVSGGEAKTGDLATAAQEEGLAVLAAAGIDVATEQEDRDRGYGVMRVVQNPERPRGGSSSWQSLARGSGSIESDFLNGEIVLLGRLHAVPTPVNATLQQVARRMAHDGAPPGSLPVAELRRLVDQARAGIAVG